MSQVTAPWRNEAQIVTAIDIDLEHRNTQVWWNTLYILNSNLNISLNFTQWEPQRPPLGMYASFQNVDSPYK
jgi:hypothetical protein